MVLPVFNPQLELWLQLGPTSGVPIVRQVLGNLTKLWEEVGQLADAANQNYHRGLEGGKNFKQNTQGAAKRSSEMVNDTKGVQRECGICLLLGSTNRAKSHSTKNHRWSANNHTINGENVSNPRQNSDRNDQQVHRGKAEKRNQTASNKTTNPGGPSGSRGTGNQSPSGSGGQPDGHINTIGTPGGGNPNPGRTARMRQKQRECPRIPRPRVTGSPRPLFRQGQGTWRHWRFLMRRRRPPKGQSPCGSGVWCRSSVRCRQRVCRKCPESSR